MYKVLVNDPPSVYPVGYFPRKYRYKNDAIQKAKDAIAAGASAARVEFPNGAELDFRPSEERKKDDPS